MRLSDGLQHAADVFHVVHVDDRVVYRTDHLHRVVLKDFATAQLSDRLEVFQLRKHRLDVTVRLEQPTTFIHYII